MARPQVFRITPWLGGFFSAGIVAATAIAAGLILTLDLVVISLLMISRGEGLAASVALGALALTPWVVVFILSFRATRSSLRGMLWRIGEWLWISVVATPIAGIALGLTTGIWLSPQNGLSALSPEAQLGVIPLTAIVVRAICKRILSSPRARIGVFRRFTPRASRAARRTLAPVLGAYGGVALASDADFQIIMLDSFLGVDPDRFGDAEAQPQFDDATWQTEVTALIADIQIAVFDVTEWSNSLEWELHECARHLPAHCILFVTEAGGARAEWFGSAAKLPTTHADVLAAALRRPLWYRVLGFRLQLFSWMRRVAMQPPLAQAPRPRLRGAVRWALALFLAVDGSLLAADCAVRLARQQSCSPGDIMLRSDVLGREHCVRAATNGLFPLDERPTAGPARLFDSRGALLAAGRIGPAAGRGPDDGAVRQDEWTFHYPDGRLRAKGSFIDNQRFGRWIFFDEQGKVTARGHYVAGQMEGSWTFLGSAGQPLQEGSFIHGRREDEWSLYCVSGALRGRGKFRDGQVVFGTWTLYSSCGEGYAEPQSPIVDGFDRLASALIEPVVEREPYRLDDEFGRLPEW